MPSTTSSHLFGPKGDIIIFFREITRQKWVECEILFFFCVAFTGLLHPVVRPLTSRRWCQGYWVWGIFLKAHHTRLLMSFDSVRFNNIKIIRVQKSVIFCVCVAPVIIEAEWDIPIYVAGNFFCVENITRGYKVITSENTQKMVSKSATLISPIASKYVQCCVEVKRPSTALTFAVPLFRSRYQLRISFFKRDQQQQGDLVVLWLNACWTFNFEGHSALKIET